MNNKLRRSGKYMTNQHGDGVKPICPYCNKPYIDGDVGDFKNYPADGLLTIFFECERRECPSNDPKSEYYREDAIFYYIPYKPEDRGIIPYET